MAFRFSLLPKWCISNKNPGFYDTESASAIEQTAKLHKTMQELIEDYNVFADEMNAKIIEFIDGSEQDQEEFAVGLRQEFQDFIDTIDLKLKDIELSFNYSEANLEKQYTLFMAEARSALDSFKQDVERIRETIKAQTKEEISTIIDEMEATGEINEILGDSISQFHERVLNLETIIKEIEDGNIFTADATSRNAIKAILVNLASETNFTFMGRGVGGVTNNSKETNINPSIFIGISGNVVAETYDRNNEDQTHNHIYYFFLKEIEYDDEGNMVNVPKGLANHLLAQIAKTTHPDWYKYTHIAETANNDSFLVFQSRAVSRYSTNYMWKPEMWDMSSDNKELYENGTITLDDCNYWTNKKFTPDVYKLTAYIRSVG